MVRENDRSVKSKITNFTTTDEQFSGRAGLAPVSRYLDAVGITGILAARFSFCKGVDGSRDSKLLPEPFEYQGRTKRFGTPGCN